MCAPIAIETDPRTLTEAMVEALGYCGVNRVTLGGGKPGPRRREVVAVRNDVLHKTLRHAADRAGDGAEFLVRSVASAFDAHLVLSAATHNRAV